MKKTYIQPVSKFAEYDEELIIATSGGDIEIGGADGPGAGENGGTDEAKKFINFSNDESIW